MSDVQRSPYTGRPVDAWLTEDLELHDAEGDEVGRVMEINPDFIVAETGAGFLGLGERHLYYVPRDQVSRADGGDWYLAIEKDQLEWAGWTQAPAESAWSQEWEEGAAPVQRSVGNAHSALRAAARDGAGAGAIVTDGTAGSPRPATGPADNLRHSRDAGSPQFLSLPLLPLAAAIGSLVDTREDVGGGRIDCAPGSGATYSDASARHHNYERKASVLDPTESARYLEVRDALTHHLREGASAAEAVDTVLLILDPEALREMAAVGLHLILDELIELEANQA